MKKIILYILILSFGVPILAQDAATNMEKYWRYRKRYMNNFIIQSDDVGACGCNIPMAEIQMTSSNATSAVGSGYIKYQLSLGDGNDGYRYYLEFLASEYYLLKQNGQDCSETIKDLYYVMLALLRIELCSEFIYAEYSMGNPSLHETISTPDINGFMLRSDLIFPNDGSAIQIPSTFANATNYKTLNSSWGYFLDVDQTNTNVYTIGGGYEEMSEDCYWNLIEGLVTVAHLVGKNSPNNPVPVIPISTSPVSMASSS